MSTLSAADRNFYAWATGRNLTFREIFDIIYIENGKRFFVQNN